MGGRLGLRVACAALIACCCLARPGLAGSRRPPLAPATDPAAAGPGADAEPSIEDLWVRGERAYHDGDLDGALRLLESALARDERRARSWNYVGGVHFARGDLVRAREHFRTAHELDPRDVRASNNLATVHERLGDYARAEELYQQAALLQPSYAETFRNLGVLYARRLGRPDAARRAWERYLELAPPGPAAEAVRRELEALPPPATPAPPASIAPPASPAPGQ